MAWKVRKLAKGTPRNFTLGQLLDAIEQNGLPKNKGRFWYSNGVSDSYFRGPNVETFEVETACAIGQGALNLGVDYDDLLKGLNTFYSASRSNRLGDSIMARNDAHGWTLKGIAKHYRDKYRSHLEDHVTMPVKYVVISKEH